MIILLGCVVGLFFFPKLTRIELHPQLHLEPRPSGQNSKDFIQFKNTRHVYSTQNSINLIDVNRLNILLSKTTYYFVTHYHSCPSRPVISYRAVRYGLKFCT